MIPNINKILHATDLSDNSAYALRYAINSALKHDAGIIILHVFELISTTNRSVLDLYLDEDLRKKIFNERVSDTIDRIRPWHRPFVAPPGPVPKSIQTAPG